MLVREVVLGGGQRCSNSIHISDPEYNRAPGLAGQAECHLGPIREGGLGEEASEPDREKIRNGMGKCEKVRASQEEGMAQAKAQRQEGHDSSKWKQHAEGMTRGREGIGAGEWLGLEPVDVGSQPRSAGLAQGARAASKALCPEDGLHPSGYLGIPGDGPFPEFSLTLCTYSRETVCSPQNTGTLETEPQWPDFWRQTLKLRQRGH